ncbi:AAA family ATPase [Actinomyces sp. zg-332]|uniref:HelD family protein n=1 Tax=Actinomyces sp. zg-332 TaxID=2708340 RepID=UPI0014239781|nr:UvrD-helicase domain-containing protein [Actinomyces sp. zg-332]QPK94414.1 AAA family ATPase [Actinomyces sp. zg-332]
MTNTSYHHYIEKELSKEQLFVNTAYNLLDFLKTEYRRQQQLIQKKGAKGTHQERTERDAFSSHYGDEATRLEQIQDKLVFGKLYMNDGSIHYIGRVGLRSNKTNEQILLDWRSKAAMPFYQATTIDPKKTILRRHISTSARKVTKFDDEILDDSLNKSIDSKEIQDILLHTDKSINTENSVLVGKNSLLNALSTARTSKMSDIVSTIQKEQDDIIRSSCSEILLVQGGPGTGKTAVALHRGAFILYEERKRLKNNGVLVIGPSKTFLNYVDNVLPSLGETGVVNSTITNLRVDTVPSRVDSLKLASIKGDLYWKEICENAVKHLRKIPVSSRIIRVDSVDLVISPNDIKKSMDKALNSYSTHNESRTVFVQSILDKLKSRYESTFNNTFNDFGEDSWIRETIRSNPEIQRTINLCWLPCDPHTLLHWLYKHPSFLEKCAPKLSKSTRDLLFYKEKSFSNNDVAIIDYLDKLLGPIQSNTTSKEDSKQKQKLTKIKQAISSQNLGGGIVNATTLLENSEQNFRESFDLQETMLIDPNWKFGHVIVDEAQELSPMQWQMLMSRCPSHSFTIVGDLDQSRNNSNTFSSWIDLLSPIFKTNIVEKVLTISYRTPKQIMDKATEIMSSLGKKVNYPVSCVREIENSYQHSSLNFIDTNEVITNLSQGIITLSSDMDKEYDTNSGKLAVVFSSRDFSTYKNLLLDFLHNKMAIFPKNRIVIIEASHTKGLEYDYVMLVNPDNIAQESLGDLYVGLTRATKKLHVVSCKNSKLPL